MIIFYLVASSFFAVLVFGYLADPNTHYNWCGDETWWGLVCFFFPQVASWFIQFTLWDLIGASIMAAYGMWLIFFYYTSIFKGLMVSAGLRREAKQC